MIRYVPRFLSHVLIRFSVQHFLLFYFYSDSAQIVKFCWDILYNCHTLYYYSSPLHL